MSYQLRANYKLPYKIEGAEVAELMKIQGPNKVNLRKSWIQENIIIPLFRLYPHSYITCYTSFGKGYTMARMIKLINGKNPDASHCFVSPSVQINQQFRDEYILPWDLQNVSDYVLKTYSKEEREFDCVFMDELDVFCGGKNNSKAIPQTDAYSIFGATATINKNQSKYLRDNGLVHIFDLPIEEAAMLELVPDYLKFNIPVTLNTDEKIRYSVAMQDYNKYLDYFGRITETPANMMLTIIGNPKSYLKQKAADELGIPTGAVLGCALKWNRSQQLRNQILSTSIDSIQSTIQLASRLDKKTVIFSKEVSTANKIHKELQNSTIYHAKIDAKVNKSNLERFKTDALIKYICCAQGLDRGMNLPDIWYGIQQSYNSAEAPSNQRFGRICRYDEENPDKLSMLFNFYVQDFTFKGVNWESQQLKWLKKSQQGQRNILWLDNLTECFKYM